MASPVKIQLVREEELAEIAQRRDKTGLTSEDVSKNLVGLCLSGGALRSASFCLGLTQALQRIGLWKFVDYLSTVSGGGYIGSYLTSSTLKDKKPVTKDYQPLNYDGTPELPARVQRFIYGGHYLLKPWQFANSYLMGVFFINLAIFSGLVAVCALIAFLWRCLDYPVIRHRGTTMLGLGDDLAAPFWPFWVFGIAWLIAWIVSAFRRGSDARGVVARYLLGLCIASLLIGCALLAGNGDIAGLDRYIAGDKSAIGGAVWGPIVALVLGGLLPFLAPKRLLKSGMEPEKPWERYLFAIASTALLVGLPLLIVGRLARENISGYNDDADRPLIPTDVKNWPVLCELIVPDRDSNTALAGNAGPNEPTEQELRFETALASAVAAIRQEAFSAPPAKQPDAVKQALSAVDLKELEPSARKKFIPKIDIGKLWLEQDLKKLVETTDPNGQQAGTAFLSKVDLSSLPPSEMKALFAGVSANAVEPEAARNVLLSVVGTKTKQPTEGEQAASFEERNWTKTELQDLNVLNLSKLSPREIKKLLSHEAFRDILIDDDLEILVNNLPPEGQVELKKTIASLQMSESERFGQAKKRTDFSEILRKPYEWNAKERTPEEEAEVDLYLGDYLVFVAKELRDEKFLRLQRDRTEFLGEGEWRRWRSKAYAKRCFWMVEWAFEGTGPAHEYWKTKGEVEQIENDVSAALNELLASHQFLQERLNALPPGDNQETKRHAARIAELRANAALTGVEDLQPHEVAEFNRLLLEQNFPNVFRDRSEIRRTVSIYEDQIARLKWFFSALAVFLVAGMWVDLNAISLHRYYRNRLAKAFIVPRNPKSPSIALSEMDTTQYGGPYHLITGSVGMIRKRFGREDDHHALRDSDEKIDQRWVDNFLFSRLYCGSELTDYVDTVAYEHSVPGYAHRIDLAEATAISGAALSPQHVDNWLLSFLMLAMNLSLGQYVPNPRAGRPRTRPRVLSILLSMWQRAERRPYCFVSDGGHCENLGVVQLLKRRCRLIIAADSSCDPKHYFHDLGRAIRMERIHAGIRLVALEKDENGEDQEFSTDDLRIREADEGDVKKGNCKKHYLLIRIKYPDAEDGLLVYIKPSFDGDESPDLVQFRHQQVEFPHDSTSDQLFDEAQVEAYRALGYHIGMQLRYRLPPEIRVGELWDYGAKVDADQLCEWFENADDLRAPERPGPIVEHPATASEETLAGIRPIYKNLIQKMRSTAKAPADIYSSQFVEIVEEDKDLQDIGIPTAVAAIQCAVVDTKQPSATDREYCVWLLQALEQDENIVTNLPESLDVLIQVAAEGNPDRVRLAAIATLAILGRGNKHRSQVKEALSKFLDDSKPSIRLAVKNALSNFRDSPRKAR